MNHRIRAVLPALVLVLVACGGGSDEKPMADMSPEEMARMTAGANQGAMDSAGAVRQAVHLTPAEERALGVAYVTVGRETLQKTIRTVGTIQTAESNVVEVVPKVEGFVERLFVATTGEAVRRGAPLLALYSPTLVAAQEEFLTARRLVTRIGTDAGEAGTAARQTLDAARRRLAYWDITEAQIAALETRGEVTKLLTLVAPVSGIVMAKDVVEGQRVMPGERLYQLADLTEVWVEGEVFEQDLALVKAGMPVHIEVAARPGEHLMGKVSFLYPTVDPVSRTNRIRLTVPNPGMYLKPGMFATIFMDAVVGRDVIVVPRAAVVVTGTRNIVFVKDAEGMLQPREVVLGERAGERVQILSGLMAGETIVGSANFLVDAESRLGGSGGAMPGMQHGTEPPKAANPKPAPMPMPESKP